MSRPLSEIVALLEREDTAKRLAHSLITRRDRYGLSDPIEARAYELITRELLAHLGVAVVGELRVVP